MPKTKRPELPWPFLGFRDFFERWKPTEAPALPPAGPRTARWHIAERTYAALAPRGRITLEVVPENDDLHVEVAQVSDMYFKASVHFNASVVEGAVPGRGLSRWQLHTATHGKSGDVVEDTVLEESGRIRGRRLVRSGALGGNARLGDDAPVRSTWGLMLFVERLVAAGARRSEQLTLLEELDVLRPGLTLSPEPDLAMPGPSGSVTLRGYKLHGPGTVPVTYWVGPTGELWFVCGVARAVVADSVWIEEAPR